MRLSDIFKRSREGERLPVSRIRSARAVFFTPDTQRVDMEIEVKVGDQTERVLLDMSLDQAAQTIKELSAAYEACRPPLHPRLGGTWGSL